MPPKISIERAKWGAVLFILGLFMCFSTTSIPYAILDDHRPRSLALSVAEPSVDLRHLSINLGGGNCKWTPPNYEVPDNVTYEKTLIAGFPSGDKRLTFVQMEALTGLPAKDEWDFAYLGDSNHPFIKANYPHHEGIWGWGSNANQTILVVKNIKRSLVEYHDILWDIGYATSWADAFSRIPNLYSARPPLEDFLAWRDERVFDEIKWYGWFIDYWMESGLMRDIFTHKITTPEHWYMSMVPNAYSRDDLDYDKVVGNITVEPSYDPHCSIDMPNGCEVVQIISGERLIDHTTGPAEGAKIVSVLEGTKGMDVMIEPEARQCVWEELILRGKGLKVFVDRPGLVEDSYEFTTGMLEEMVEELNRLINKYSQGAWTSMTTANDLVDLLSEHRTLIQDDIVQAQAPSRGGVARNYDE